MAASVTDDELERPHAGWLVGAEEIGKRRAWKAEAAATFARMRTVFHAPDTRWASMQLARGSGNHYAAAAILERAFGGVATLRVKHLGRKPSMVWAALNAREETLLTRVDEKALSFDEEQGGAEVWFVATARMPVLLQTALWSMLITNHAIWRYFSRVGPNADLSAAILEAHLRVIATPARNLEELVSKRGFLAPTPRGAFRCDLTLVVDAVTRQRVPLIRARTWVNDGLIFDEQSELSRRLLTPINGEQTLASTIFHTEYLKHIIRGGRDRR